MSTVDEMTLAQIREHLEGGGKLRHAVTGSIVRAVTGEDGIYIFAREHPSQRVPLTSFSQLFMMLESVGLFSDWYADETSEEPALQPHGPPGSR